MIKRTLLFSNPAFLSTKDDQLVFQHPETKEKRSVPIEDIGIIVLEHPQITISSALMAKLVANNASVITCDVKHLPNGLFMPLSGHSMQTLRMRQQIEASLPLKKQLWQQTVQAKIRNQAAHLQSHKIDTENMYYWASEVRSGDPDNYEARAAAYYWSKIFMNDLTPNPTPSGEETSESELSKEEGRERFLRDRFGESPNHFLNYAYAILRAGVARSLVGSGLLPTFGIHHKNQYNAYCLADDIMEPFRPYADKLVKDLLKSDAIPQRDGIAEAELTPAHKQFLLQLPVMDILIEGKRSPLMVGLQTTTASLSACFEGKTRKISYPEFTSP